MLVDPVPFHIDVPDARLKDLKARLALATFPDELDEAGWDYGAPLADVKRLTAYWKDEFDWKNIQHQLNNDLPQFQIDVEVDSFDPVNIHFIHQRSTVANAIPLLFVHGWPGNFLEVQKLLPLLKGSASSPAFHVVAPSLPNYAFSAGIKKKGFGLPKYAETCHRLMLKLGYEQYVTQGGDWGFFITRCLGLLYPEHCLASHVNMVPARAPTFMSQPLLALQHLLMPYTARDHAGFARTQTHVQKGRGYKLEQSTKPQTIGYGLADSPVALLAWIFEKLHHWTDHYPWTDDEILTWISIYWFSTAGPAASVRIYYEAEQPKDAANVGKLTGWIPHVKLGLAHFPRELAVFPPVFGRTLGPVVSQSVHNSGGHFAAWEKPGEIVKDLNDMFGKGGPCAGIIKGRDGY